MRLADTALRLDRLAVRAARGGAVRQPGRFLRPLPRRRSRPTPSCGATSASASTWPTATDPSRPSSAADLPQYIERDPALAEALHRFRSSGKRLFLLTNSDWAYTDPVMSYLLGGALPAYPSWRNFFDVIIVSGTKPAFFTEERPFVELDASGQPLPRASTGPFVRGRVYAGGNLREFEERARAKRGGRPLHRRSHLRRHVALAKVVGLADRDGAAGAGARGAGARPGDPRPRAPGRSRTPAAPPGRRDQRQADGAAGSAAPGGRRWQPAGRRRRRAEPSAR